MDENVFVLKDYKTVPDIVHEYTPTLKEGNIPLVIDNGSYQCRVGWAIDEEPRLVFKNLIARPRKERVKKDAEPPVTPPMQIGNDIINMEAVRFQLKTQFDKNVVTHFEAQEQVLDYIFSHLGIDSEGSVPHPILMTEALVNPNYCRQLMSELLFEAYKVPAVCYGVDSLFSMYRNKIGDTALIINCGYHTIHILPVLRGKPYVQYAKRINLGGNEMTNYLQKLLHLKYPVHLNAITLSRVEEILHEHCWIALDYQEEIRKWFSAEYYDANVKKIQLPFAQSAASTPLSAEAQKERKKEMARRLLEINARKREEKLIEDQEYLSQLLAVQEMIDEDSDPSEIKNILQNLDIKNDKELERRITLVHGRIEQIKLKIAQLANNEEPVEVRAANTKYQPPSDPEAFNDWIVNLRTKYRDLMSRREARKARRADMARRRTAAAAERMRVISRLTAAGDDFGARDEDWDVYKSISREADSESEADAEQVLEMEVALRTHEPAPSPHTHHQLHLALETIRAPEVMFQPSMLGVQSAGIAEVLAYVFRYFSEEDQLLLANNVFLCGGCSKFPGLKERLERELLEMRPFQSSHRVVLSREASGDAWLGARDFAAEESFPAHCVTPQMYREMGADYLLEHHASNRYYCSPAPLDSPAVDGNVVKEEIVDICF